MKRSKTTNNLRNRQQQQVSMSILWEYEVGELQQQLAELEVPIHPLASKH